MNRLIPFALSALLHLYVGSRLIPSLAAWHWATFSLAAMLLLSFVSLHLGLQFRRRAHRFADQLAWVSMTAMGLFSSLFVLTLLRDALLLLNALVALVSSSAWSPSIDTFTAAVAPLSALLITAIGMWNARRTASVVRIDVPIANLPDALHGFTIAQITDIHVGSTIKGPYVENIVTAVNRLNADMVAVTGDLVDGSVAELADHVLPLAKLSSRHGTFFVTGNHEYYSGARSWIAELRRLGLHVLLNEHVVLHHDTATLVIAGVTDISAHHFDTAHRSSPQSAIAGAPDHALIRVLLAHQPRSAQDASNAGFHLQLSGHTPRRTILAVEFFRASATALYRRAAPAPGPLGVCQSRHRLLGTAQALRCAFGDYALEVGARGHLIVKPALGAACCNKCWTRLLVNPRRCDTSPEIIGFIFLTRTKGRP